MNTYEEISFENLLLKVNELRDNDFFFDMTPLSFSEEVRDGEPMSLWGICPVSLFDDDTYLVGKWGGDDTFAIDLTDCMTKTECCGKFAGAMRERLHADTVWLEKNEQGEYQ